MTTSVPSATSSTPNDHGVANVGSGPGGDERAMAAAREFESMAVGEMLQPIFQTVGQDEGLFGGGAAERLFKPMLVEQIAKSVEQAGGIGLSDTIYRQMLIAQEHKS